MKNALICAFLLFSLAAQSQNFYNDIVGTRALGERMKTYLNQKVSKVTATGYDAMGAKSPDYNEIQEINAAARSLKISTREGQSVTRQYYRFDDQSRVISVVDSSGNARNTSTYIYDNDNNLVSIVSSSNDSLNDFNESEAHLWFYKAGKPERMWRIVNGKDSTEYRFTTDEKGNTADEQLFRKNTGFDKVYYYYDEESNHLTDIVRYDKKVKKLLPDFMFEYDDNGRVIQKITTISTASRNYLIWRYVFNDKGLKTKEALFNKLKELTGKIEYAYIFGQ